MKDNRCFICKYLGKTNTDTSRNTFYLHGDKSVKFPLCHHHSVEFFKIGQTNFVLKHKNSFNGQFGHKDDASIIETFNDYARAS